MVQNARAAGAPVCCWAPAREGAPAGATQGCDCEMCPECGSNHLAIKQYDYGACRETGYHDAGERFHCRDCGDEGDVSEIRCVGDAY